MTADAHVTEILARCRAVYRTCTSYRDTGEVRTVFISGTQAFQRRTSLRLFATEFVRPDRFRFEYSDAAVGPESEWTRMVIWQNRSRIRSWWTLGERLQEHEDLLMPLGSATGVSGGSAYTIPSLLLFPEHDFLTRFPDATLHGTEQIAGNPCFCIDLMEDRRPTKAWIDAGSFVIRQIHEIAVFNAESRAKQMAAMEKERRSAPSEEHRVGLESAMEHLRGHQPNFTTESTTTYDPVLNGDIPPDLFEFTPTRREE